MSGDNESVHKTKLSKDQEVMGGQVAGTGGEWQRELPGKVSDCYVPRAPGGLGERRPPVQTFGNDQRWAASKGGR